MSIWRRDQDYYKGLIMGCAPGAHEKLVELVASHVPHRSGVLDCGCRSGALLTRLQDNGFSDMVGLDLDTEIFGGKDVDLRLVDLNSAFSEGIDRQFNLVTCSEVMEHLDSPRHFMTHARNLLADDGYLAISVPNIAFWVGRVKFALFGEHWGYGEKFYRSARHVSPQTVEETLCTLREVGFEIVEVATAGSFDSTLKATLLKPFHALLKAMGARSAVGECLIVLARKAAPDESLSKPDLYFESWTIAKARQDKTEPAAAAAE